MLSSTAYFGGDRYVILNLIEFVIGVDKGNGEATLFEDMNNFVDTSNDIFGTTLIGDFDSFGVFDDAADFVEREDALEFDEFLPLTEDRVHLACTENQCQVSWLGESPG